MGRFLDVFKTVHILDLLCVIARVYHATLVKLVQYIVQLRPSYVTDGKTGLTTGYSTSLYYMLYLK